MELEGKYNPENDIYAQREVKRDWAKLFMDNQVLEPKKTELHYLHPHQIQKTNRKQIIEGLGLWNPGFYLTTLGFLYLGGLYHARSQKILSNTYFLSKNFDFVGGKCSILLGLSFGIFMGSTIFGNPYLTKDWIKSKINSMGIVNASIIIPSKF